MAVAPATSSFAGGAAMAGSLSTRSDPVATRAATVTRRSARPIAMCFSLWSIRRIAPNRTSEDTTYLPRHHGGAGGSPAAFPDTFGAMRFGIDVAQQRMPFSEVVSRVQLAEELGFDGAWGFDHFQPMYGDGPGETFDGVTTLAALTGVTSRIRLGLLVTGVTYRHPSVFATQMVTIDHASGGRLELSLGAAWHDKEHHELGIPFPPTGKRFDLLEDALEICTRLMTGEKVSYDG